MPTSIPKNALRLRSRQSVHSSQCPNPFTRLTAQTGSLAARAVVLTHPTAQRCGWTASLRPNQRQQSGHLLIHRVQEHRAPRALALRQFLRVSKGQRHLLSLSMRSIALIDRTRHAFSFLPCKLRGAPRSGFVLGQSLDWACAQTLPACYAHNRARYR